jgi:hypothetical protein
LEFLISYFHGDRIYKQDYFDVTFLQLYPQMRRQTMSMPSCKMLAFLRALGALRGRKNRLTAKETKEREGRIHVLPGYHSLPLFVLLALFAVKQKKGTDPAPKKRPSRTPYRPSIFCALYTAH